jgi:transcriptional regulator with XRE-family HTH domain
MSIGERIRLARKTRELSQRNIAALVGITPGAVSQWESDETVPNVERLSVLAKVLGVEIGWLVAGIGATLLEQPARSGESPVNPVRVIGSLRGDGWDHVYDWPPNQQFDIIVPIDSRFIGMAAVALRIRGSSSFSLYPDGTFLTFVPATSLGSGFQFHPGDRILVQRRNEFGVLERAVKEFTGQENGLDGAGNGTGFEIAALVIGSYRPERPLHGRPQQADSPVQP